MPPPPQRPTLAPPGSLRGPGPPGAGCHRANPNLQMARCCCRCGRPSPSRGGALRRGSLIAARRFCGPRYRLQGIAAAVAAQPLGKHPVNRKPRQRLPSVQRFERLSLTANGGRPLADVGAGPGLTWVQGSGCVSVATRSHAIFRSTAAAPRGTPGLTALLFKVPASVQAWPTD